MSAIYMISAAQTLPTAGFTVSSPSGCAPLTIQFINNSSNANSYFWDFGNGNSSTASAPSNVYLNPGNYSITLIASNSYGSDTLILQNAIQVNPKPNSSFSASVLNACVNNNQIQFTNSSTGAGSYLWDFGDGDTSNLQNPNHTFSLSGTYSIKLISTNTNGCQDIFIRNQYITIQAKPLASFSSTSQFSCNTNQAFQFNAGSQNNSNSHWNFGDGITSSQTNPTHTYASYGTFDVTHIVTNTSGCKDTLTKPAYIAISNTVQPAFSTTDSLGCPPFNTTFSGPSGMISYSWNFGDGTNSTLQNPIKDYVSTGSYTVSLTTVNSQGCSSTATKTNYIQVTAKPQSNFSIVNAVGCSPLSVSFNNNSLNAVSYLWNFGDYTTSTLANPVHVYTNNGSYSVSLKAYGANGCEDEKIISTAVNVGNTKADFNSNTPVGCAPLSVSFNHLSGGAVSWEWNFGDGTTSTAPYPVKTYSTPGTFDVTLIVTNNYGCKDTLVKQNYVNVVDPYANYNSPQINTGCVPYTISLTDIPIGSSTWLWNFGDGNTSTIQNPTHTYNTSGIFVVSLTTSTPNGCTYTINNFATYEVKGAAALFNTTYTACPPYIGTFQDSSANAVSWFWNFGDGVYSTQQNPTHIFPGYGSYDVSLTITTADGCAHTNMQTSAVTFVPLSAQFSYATNDTTFPATVQFLANSVGANDWWWDFGDGGTSWLENPTHTFMSAGNYTISLWISNGECNLTFTIPSFEFGSGLDSNAVNVINGPSHVPQTGCAPLQIQFTDTTDASVAWIWHFGDGSTSSLQDPNHIYLNPGIYSPYLIFTNSFGVIDTVHSVASIIVSGPKANFALNQSSLCQGITISLTDSSTGASLWNWNFGDNTSSTLQNPTHTYSGTNTNAIVQLMVRDTIGCSNFKSVYLSTGLSNPISAASYKICANDSISFLNNSTNAVSYAWDFGDGNTSTDASPTHAYSNGGNYTVNLTVVDTSGCSVTHILPSQVIVTKHLANFSVNGPVTACGSLTTWFLNSSLPSDSFLWSFGDGTTSASAHPFHQYTSIGSYDVTLTAVKDGCTSTFTMINAVSVANPIADFTMNTTSTCLPMTVNFVDQSQNSNTWFWDFGDGTTSTLQNPSHTFTSNSAQNITLTVTDGATCNSTKSLPTPLITVAGFSPSAVSGCNPFTVTFTDSSLNPTSWFWDFGDGNLSTLQNPVHTFLNAGNYTITLITTSASGCADTMQVSSLINVNAPVAEFDVNNNAACAPSLIRFNDLSTDAVFWHWDFGDSTYSAIQNPSKIYSTPGIYDVTLIVGNTNGCTDTLIKQSFVTINGPVATFTVSNQTSCTPALIQFMDQSLNAVSWAWNFGNGLSSTLQNPTMSYPDTGTFVVSLITTDSLGCESLFTLAQPVEIFPTPIASFSTNLTQGCAPYALNVTNTTIGGDNYIWDFGDGNVSYQVAPNHVYTQQGQYVITLIAISQYGCSDTAVSVLPIQIGLQPTAAFSSIGTTGCAPHSVSFNNNSQFTTTATSYFWDLGNGSTSTLQNPSAVYTQAGSYTITLIVSNAGGCSDTLIMHNYISVFDDVAPKNSEIYTIDVLSDTQIGVHYSYVTDLDLAAYRIFRKSDVDPNYTLIYTQISNGNTSFSLDTLIADSGLDTKNRIYTYKIQTVDLCGNTTVLTNLKEYRSINLNAATVINGVSLNWNSYSNCTLSSYEIQRAGLGSSAFNTIASVGPNVTSYLDAEQTCTQIFTYRIIAKDLCGRPFDARSDTSAALLPGNTDELKADIIRTTVIDDRNTITEWTAPASGISNVKAYMVYRSVDFNNYQLVATLSSLATEYLDMNTEVHASKYMYTVAVVNNCDYEGNKGKIGSTVLLKAAMNNGVPVLTWSNYMGWDSGVEQYKIERQNADGSWSIVGKTDGGTNMFIDR